MKKKNKQAPPDREAETCEEKIAEESDAPELRETPGIFPGLFPEADISTGDIFFLGSGTEIIRYERWRQISGKEYGPDHDAGHTDESLAAAAACYAYPGRIFIKRHEGENGILFTEGWPLSWSIRYDKRRRIGGVMENDTGELVPHHRMTLVERIDLLGKAGALIAAEIDRWRELIGRLPGRLLAVGAADARADFHTAVSPYMVAICRDKTAALYACREKDLEMAKEKALKTGAGIGWHKDGRWTWPIDAAPSCAAKRESTALDVRLFLEKWFILDATGSTEVSAVYLLWETWCQKNGMSPGPVHELVEMLTAVAGIEEGPFENFEIPRLIGLRPVPVTNEDFEKEKGDADGADRTETAPAATDTDPAAEEKPSRGPCPADPCNAGKPLGEKEL